MNYKETLHLPTTQFPMKADLPKREPAFLERWESQKVYETMLAKGTQSFVLHDGPPYANGHIHFGHILNKILKDIIVKYKSLNGFKAPYVPGWDCHGLPIELGAMKDLGAKEKDPVRRANPLVRRQACREYATKYINDQREQFKRLGIFGDWENPYLTLTNPYEADIAREFVKLYEKGYAYRGKKPVYWCVSCRTALAEAEVEYESHTSPSIYVKFDLKNPDALGLSKAALVIWTTTPWTLPANLALAIGERFEYVALEVNGEILVVAADLKDAFLKALQIAEPVKEKGCWSGAELTTKKLVAQHPFLKRSSPVFPGDHVSLEAGTGVVHIAPGHGMEDYQIGQKFGLETLCPVDEAGALMKGSLDSASFEEIKAWEGLKVFEANKQIVPFLAAQKILLNQPNENLSHSYPHCWRCKNPVIYRATEQWFCSLEHEDLRKRSLEAIDKKIEWIPGWGHDRIYGMIENRPDWCLSRQRIWGVPIIVHYCNSCKEPLLNAQIGEGICKVFEEEGADAWWKENDLLPKGTHCTCGGQEFTREKSILDVWFDSGVSHAAVLKRRKELSFPADLYLEGSDQHRGWFHSSLLTSMATNGVPPYKAVLTHGFVVDGEGRKYSKSAKNYVPPDKILKELGAELLRLWVGAEDYRNDIRVSDEIIKVLAEVYRKIRNTCRFLLGNLSDFDPIKNSVPFEKRTELDRYALHMLSDVVAKVKNAYEKYEFHVVHHALNKFFTVDLSATYLDILKDRLYCDATDGHLRRSAQSTLQDILMAVVPLMAPILSFTAEEIWQLIPGAVQQSATVFGSRLPGDLSAWKNPKLEADWLRIGQIRTEALKALEVARKEKKIGHPLDAKVVLEASGDMLAFLKRYVNDWTQIFIVSQVEINPHVGATHASPLQVTVENAQGIKCERCWNYSLEVGKQANHPTLCGRCARAVS